MYPNDTTQEIPYGYCHCGCGQQTRIATRTNPTRGYRMGEHVRYLPGHNPPIRISVEDYFWAHCTPGKPSECWEWQSTTLICNGYGAFHLRHRKYYVHRVSWELHNKQSIPEGIQVCHECDNKKCWNPNHLFLGTNQDNIDDKMRKGRQPRGEANHAAKLKAGDVIEIRQLAISGMKKKSIAERFHIHPSTLSGILNYSTWRHLK